jgi:CheY-like chemotaxis protein
MSNPNLIYDLSLPTKALMVVNEFTTRRMEAPQLAELLAGITRTTEEYRSVIELIQNELRAASYPPSVIATMIDALSAAAPVQNASAQTDTEGTQHLRSPFHARFDPSGAASPAPLAAPPAGRPAPVPPPRRGHDPRPMEATQAARSFTGTAPPAAAASAEQTAPLPAAGGVEGSGGYAAARTLKPIRMPPGAAPVVPEPKAKRLLPTAGSPRKMEMPRAKGESQVYFGNTFGTISQEKATPAMDDESLPLILVADDDKRIRMIYRIKLEEAGYRVAEEADGLSAWNFIHDRKPDLVVLDMKMPGCHGLEVMNRMVSAGLLIPLVISSAYDQLSEEFVVATYPKYKYLTKPVGPDQVLAAVEELLKPSDAETPG